jgi:hypothetical protein
MAATVMPPHDRNGYSMLVRLGIIDGLREAVDNRTAVVRLTGPAFAKVNVS